jgi:DNA-binding transcriptional LysR family regulator
VSAHIKTLEDELGLSLFDRTSRGMTLTAEGKRLLARAEQTISAHRELLEEAARARGGLSGKLRLAAGNSSNHEAIGRLLAGLAQRCPDVQVTLEHRPSREILAGLRDESLDAGFYNEAGEPDPQLATVELATFGIYLVTPKGERAGWKALEKKVWIFPKDSTCCAGAAERLFEKHKLRPAKIINVDREELTRTLVASGLGVGILHEASAREAERRGELEVVEGSQTKARVLFAQLARRASEPVLAAATELVRG